jgi:hypothetical protein
MGGVECGAMLYLIISFTQMLHLDGTTGLFTRVPGWLVGWLVKGIK